MNNLTVSFGKNIKSNSVEVIGINEIFEKIKTDNELKDKIEIIRSIAGEKERRDKKTELLPYFITATFNGNVRLNENLITANMMVLDFDHLGDKLYAVYESAKIDPDAYFIFRSPSGDGLKIGFLFERPITTSSHYESVYLKYKEIKEIQYSADADQVTKNASRPCFLSYDPDLVVNENAKKLIVTDVMPISKVKKIEKMEELNFTEIESSKTKYVPAAVKFLRMKLQGYDDWMKCGFALASLGEEGRGYFHILSSNPAYEDSYDFIDEKFDNLLQRAKGKIELATLFEIAKKYGFNYPELNKKNIIEPPSISSASFGDMLRDKFDFDDKRDPNKLLGYPLDKFKTLAKNLDGIQPGFYLISADSNVGKTAFLTNICLDLMMSNPDVKVVYFSLDDSKFYTVYRFLSILTQFHINDVRKFNADPNKQNTLNAKRELIIDLVESGRLIIKDLGDLNHIDQIIEILDSLGSFEKMVVIIDGMYNLTVDSKDGIRMENIARAQTLKEIVDKFQIPLLATGELRKKTKDEGLNKKPSLHDLSETGKYAYNANVVLLISPVSAAQLKEDNSALNVEYVKNKLSDFKGIQPINFIRATGTMEEINISISIPTSPQTAGGDDEL